MTNAEVRVADGAAYAFDAAVPATVEPAADASVPALQAVREAGVAANAIAQSGDLPTAKSIIASAEQDYPDVQESHPFAAVKAYFMAIETGEIELAHRDLTVAVTEPEAADDPRVFNEILAMLIVSAHMGSNVVWWADAAKLAADHDAIVDPVNRFTLDVYFRTEVTDPARRAQVRRAVEASTRTGPSWKMTVLFAAGFRMNWHAEDTQFIDRLLDGSQLTSKGITSTSVRFLTSRRRTATWQELRDGALEVLSAMPHGGLGPSTAKLHGVIAVAEAYLGNANSSREHAAVASAWALPRGLRLILEDTLHARTVLALSESRFEDAYSFLTQLPLEPTRWSTSGQGAAELLDLADACEAVGRPDDAAASVELAIEFGVGNQAPRQAMMLRAAQAVIERNEDVAEHLFLSSLSIGDQVSAPFDTARVRLVYGRFLSRRKGDFLRARAQVKRALPDFEALGAAGWAARAQSELASYQAPIQPTIAAKLSPQEQLVASMAAQGMTNKQIAEKLFISSRTVSYHLYNVFPKLGVTSRAGLRDALNSVAGQHPNSGS